MDKLFGIPMQDVLSFCVIALAFVVAVVAALALKNRVFFRLGARKIRRRPGRTIIVVLGLMLGTTIITAAFSTGDTMSNTVRQMALRGLGRIDEVISAKRGDVQGPGEEGAPIPYFDISAFEQVRAAAQNLPDVDGVAPAIGEGVAVQDLTQGQNEPRMTLMAADARYQAGFDVSRRVADGSAVSVDSLAGDEVYLTRKAADNLDAQAGDKLLMFAAGESFPLTVKDVVDQQGTGNDGPAMLMRLDVAQRLLHHEGGINYILISNKGDAFGGVGKTDRVVSELEPTLRVLGLEATSAKQDAVDLADEAGSAFTTLFVTFGMFSIAAGMMLIFLIFVMVAAERKSEMGIARAVGTQRGHLVQMFLFEGMIYDVVAAAIGALLGIAVAFGMVYLLAQGFGQTELKIVHDVRPRSLVVAYSLGVILTFAIVTLSAWRVSVLNIVSAIRDIPEEGRRKGGKRGWIAPALLILAGILLAVSGLQSQARAPFILGSSLLIIALVPILRRLGASDRIAYSTAGLGLTLWMLLPASIEHKIVPSLNSDFTVFVVGGLIAVVGGTWTVMYNSDLLLGALMAVASRLQLFAAVVKTAVSRSLSNRFRTGMAVAMFAIVVLTLVVMAVVRSSIVAKFNNYERFGGGFDVQASILRLNPIDDIDTALQTAPGVNASDIEAVSAQSLTMIEARQVGASAQEFEDYGVRGLDDEYLARSTLPFARIAPGYANDRAVWQALASDPQLAVIDSLPVPRRSNYDISVGLPPFHIEGFYIDDKDFRPFDVEVRDPQTGRVATYTIIAILQDSMSPFSWGIQASQRSLDAAFADQVRPSNYLFKLRPGVDSKKMASALESAFLQNGMDATDLHKALDDGMAMQSNFDYLFQGFAALGLIVGVAALGVISARAVVERRQQIGVLRAIGFQRGMVQMSFLIESSFVALVGIAVGTVLGLVISYNVVTEQSSSGSMGDVAMKVPWLNLLIIFAAAYAVSLLATLIPARQASRVYPAEALRYE